MVFAWVIFLCQHGLFGRLLFYIEYELTKFAKEKDPLTAGKSRRENKAPSPHGDGPASSIGRASDS